MASPLADVLNRSRSIGLDDDEYSDNGLPGWLLSAAMKAPPDRPEMTRALPGYDTRDPNELAMLRHREMVRPQAGRGDFTPEHLANMATAAAMFTPAGAALAPEFAAGRMIAAGAQYAPRLTTAALAGGGALAPSMAGGAEDPQAVRNLQMQLRDAGYYRGEIDGRMGPGTQRAQQDFTAAEATRKANEIKEKELANTAGANTATLETARANQKTAEAKIEADRLQGERDAAILARKQAADERIREIDKNLSPMSRIIRDYSGPAGLALGTLLGAGGRAITAGASSKYTREAAKAGDEIMAADVAAGKKGADAALARATRANEFWREGGAKEVPFLLEPGKAPGFAVNPKATALNKTYNPNIHPAVEGAAIAPALVEEEVSRHYKGEWEQKLADAEKAVSEDPSEVNIQRLNKAQDRVALFEGLQRLGMSTATVQGIGAVGNRFMKKAPDMRPNMQPAEQEQGSLQKAIRDAVAAAEKKAVAAEKKSAKGAPRVVAPQVGVPPGMTGPAATRARTLHSL